MGARGMGEIGITGTAAAIANAVFHATGKRVKLAHHDRQATGVMREIGDIVRLFERRRGEPLALATLVQRAAPATAALAR